MATIIVGCILRLFLTAPLPSVYREAWVDDLLYTKTADHLLRGEWLGPYDVRILVKEMGYPLFLAGASAVGLPKRAAEDLLLCVAVITLAWALRRMGLGRIGTLVASMTVLFNPATSTMLVFQTIRQGVSHSQVVLIVALAMALLAPGGLWLRSGVSVALGVTLAWFWHTREESIWILPCVLVFALTITLAEVRRRASILRGMLVALLLIVPVGALVVGANALLRLQNERAYGAPIEIEPKDPDYVAACASIARVTLGHWEHWQPLTKEARARLYELSPAFASLRPTMEGNGYHFAGAVADDGEVMLNYVYWLVREAAANAGWYESLPKAKAFYRQLATEINAACDAGQIPCGPPRTSLAASFEWSLFPEFFAVWTDTLADMWRFRLAPCGYGPSEGHDAKPASDAIYRRVLREPTVPPLDGATVTRFEVLARIRVLFQEHTRWLALLGGVALVVQIVLLRRRRAFDWIGMEVALLGAVASLDAVSSFVRTYWWPTWNLYVVCVYPLLPVLAVVAISGALKDLRAAIESRITPRVSASGGRALAAASTLGLIGLGLAGWAQASADCVGIAMDGVPLAVFRAVDPGPEFVRPILRMSGAHLAVEVDEGVGIQFERSDGWARLRLQQVPASPRVIELDLEVVDAPPGQRVVMSCWTSGDPRAQPEGAAELAVVGPGRHTYRLPKPWSDVRYLAFGLDPALPPGRVVLHAVRSIDPDR